MKPHNPPAFPLANQYTANGESICVGQSGMSLRDYIAIHAPEPAREDVHFVMQMEQQANPHNDSYKPRRRGEAEIRCALRYKFADAMLEERNRER